MEFYDVDSSGFIDYDYIAKKISCFHPRLVLAGASAYSREIDFEKIYNIICDTAGSLGPLSQWSEIGRPYFMIDMAHSLILQEKCV